MTYRNGWYLGSTYISDLIAHDEGTSITFEFPNAATEKGRKFTTWLYRFDERGNTIETNLAAVMLQCFVEDVGNIYKEEPTT